MAYGIGALTKGDEYEIVVKIVCRHKGIRVNSFRRGIDNVFEDLGQAQKVAEEVRSNPRLKDCCVCIYEAEQED